MPAATPAPSCAADRSASRTDRLKPPDLCSHCPLPREALSALLLGRDLPYKLSPSLTAPHPAGRDTVSLAALQTRAIFSSETCAAWSWGAGNPGVCPPISWLKVLGGPLPGPAKDRPLVSSAGTWAMSKGCKDRPLTPAGPGPPHGETETRRRRQQQLQGTRSHTMTLLLRNKDGYAQSTTRTSTWSPQSRRSETR